MTFTTPTSRSGFGALRVEVERGRDAQEIVRETLSDEVRAWHIRQRLKDMVDSPDNAVLVLTQDGDLTPLINIGGNQQFSE